MKVNDPDWKAIFGTDDSQIEPPPKAVKARKLTKCQQQAGLIVDRPELFGGASKAPPQRKLFD